MFETLIVNKKITIKNNITILSKILFKLFSLGVSNNKIIYIRYKYYGYHIFRKHKHVVK